MADRSNINLVGNSTVGQNLGTGEGVYASKLGGNRLQYKSLSSSDTATLKISSDGENIYLSGATGGGGSGSITGGANGLSTSGDTIVLGGTLTGATTVDGNFYSHNLCFLKMNDLHIEASCQIALCGSATNQVLVSSGVRLVRHPTVDSHIEIFNLPAKTTETDVLYIDSTGKIASGATSGGGSPGGASTNVQFNQGGSFSGTSDLTFDGTNLDVTGSVCAADFELTSDERCKTNICEYIPSLADVQYKQFELCNCLGQTRFGVVAQELQNVYPEVVRTNEEGYLSVSYIDLLVREVAYLKNKIKELEKKIL